MAVNFCHEYLGTKILSSQVSTDSHEIENLISSNLASKNRGFLAGSFVRPPVDIIVQFPCPVKICCLTLNGRVGCQQSTGCEVFVQSEKASKWTYSISRLFALLLIYLVTLHFCSLFWPGFWPSINCKIFKYKLLLFFLFLHQWQIKQFNII